VVDVEVVRSPVLPVLVACLPSSCSSPSFCIAILIHLFFISPFLVQLAQVAVLFSDLSQRPFSLLFFFFSCRDSFLLGTISSI
jgi:hypothetical protein